MIKLARCGVPVVNSTRSGEIHILKSAPNVNNIGDVTIDVYLEVGPGIKRTRARSTKHLINCFESRATAKGDIMRVHSNRNGEPEVSARVQHVYELRLFPNM
ncbi:hypothetical protein RHS04_00187 [Rhizoctonia solani]|uniref:Uncharacterized protein n=1 Tax=Rhizoctonia solani TaxID=456999 RepID=A0A8H7HI48_9AGAM|nr:hypothetical protein RHS04_00187 [Rhizoctonia solani]